MYFKLHSYMQGYHCWLRVLCPLFPVLANDTLSGQNQIVLARE